MRGSRLVRAVGQGEPERGVPGGEHADEGSAATLHRQLDAYLNEVVSHDWPQMREGRLGDDSERMIAAMYASALRANPATNAQPAAQQNMVGQLDSLLAARSQRAADAVSPLPAGLLAAVLATSAVVIAFPFAGGLRVSTVSLSMAGLQAVLVAVGVVVVFQLNLAYTGDRLAITRAAWPPHCARRVSAFALSS